MYVSLLLFYPFLNKARGETGWFNSHDEHHLVRVVKGTAKVMQMRSYANRFFEILPPLSKIEITPRHSQ
jgi:hypothetical protein